MYRGKNKKSSIDNRRHSGKVGAGKGMEERGEKTRKKRRKEIKAM